MIESLPSRDLLLDRLTFLQGDWLKSDFFLRNPSRLSWLLINLVKIIENNDNSCLSSANDNQTCWSLLVERWKSLKVSCLQCGFTRIVDFRYFDYLKFKIKGSRVDWSFASLRLSVKSGFLTKIYRYFSHSSLFFDFDCCFFAFASLRCLLLHSSHSIFSSSFYSFLIISSLFSFLPFPGDTKSTTSMLLPPSFLALSLSNELACWLCTLMSMIQMESNNRLLKSSKCRLISQPYNFKRSISE